MQQNIILLNLFVKKYVLPNAKKSSIANFPITSPFSELLW